jgi:hypothetical protein
MNIAMPPHHSGGSLVGRHTREVGNSRSTSNPGSSVQRLRRTLADIEGVHQKNLI